MLLGGICLIMGRSFCSQYFPVSLPAPVLGAAAVACLRRESASKWSRYKITLPVRRRDIVKSQYITPWDLCFGRDGLRRDIPVPGSYHPWEHLFLLWIP